MSSDIQPGDLVVCVDDGPLPCPHLPGMHWGGDAPRRNAVGRVIDQGPAVWDSGPPAIIGTRCGCVALVLDSGARGVAQRFRKLPPYQERFAEQFRTSLPSDERVKEPASC